MQRQKLLTYFSQQFHIIEQCMDEMKDFKINPEFSILELTFHLYENPMGDISDLKNLFLFIGLDKEFFERKIIIFLANNLNMCYGCSKEPSQKDGSFEYP